MRKGKEHPQRRRFLIRIANKVHCLIVNQQFDNLVRAIPTYYHLFFNDENDYLEPNENLVLAVAVFSTLKSEKRISFLSYLVIYEKYLKQYRKDMQFELTGNDVSQIAI